MENNKAPYLMTREEWKAERDKCRPGWVQQNYTRHSKSQAIARHERLTFLLFGVGEWIYDKAMHGEEWALEAWEYDYDTYNMIIKKAKEEGLI